MGIKETISPVIRFQRLPTFETDINLHMIEHFKREELELKEKIKKTNTRYDQASLVALSHELKNELQKPYKTKPYIILFNRFQIPLK